ncbi:DUF3152 domain-containing protein [Streptomyces sp. TRM64462]|uniref:DUF3152 domain-containing protein n=1 Tax=Streptomyces sp. TRM64462 TaxID=2741726 RepID=UPI002814C3B2|nr:DUF3152 domain-containing protein [Streptomyces sp. TRM64462]
MLGALALGAVSLGTGAALAHLQGGGGVTTAVGPADLAPSSPRPDERRAASPGASPGSGARTSPSPARSASSSSSPSASGSPSPSVTAGGSSSPAVPASVPASGPGTFTSARTAGAAVGSGPLRRYRVQVEDGIGISAADAAREIEAILAHPRGWAAHGRGSFQLVTENADFVIRIATPKTADKLCLAQGLNTRGEYNCETTEGVVVNLKRWLTGSPTFSGTPAEYRHLIINHEIGHEIGIRTHMACPGPGKPAPVMMQQIKGLHGCVSNAWPYDEDGRYITGPIVP